MYHIYQQTLRRLILDDEDDGSSSASSGRNITTAGMAGPWRLQRGTRTARRETGVLSPGTDTLGYDNMAEDEETDRCVAAGVDDGDDGS